MSAATDGPIFVVGAPRSGTSLLRAMLNRHPRLGLCDETFFFYWVAERQRVFGDLADATRRARAIDRFLETRRIARLGLDRALLRTHLQAAALDYPRFFRALLDFYARAQGKARGGEKTPQHALVARTLLDWYPDARLLHIVRDPRDVVASLKRMPWGSGSRLADARLWSACVAAAAACADDPRHGPRCLLVRYETLIAEPGPELARVCAFLGEPFVPAMVASDPGAKAQKSDRWWFDRARGGVETTRVERWRQELAPAEIAVIEWVAGAALARYGYAPAAPPASSALRARARLQAAGAGLARRVRQLPALWYRWFRPDRLAAEEAVIDGAGDPPE